MLKNRIVSTAVQFSSVLILTGFINSCKPDSQTIEIYQTSADGHKMKALAKADAKPGIVLKINPDERFQTIAGFGGAFTESSAYLLNQLSDKNRTAILEAYFGEEGSRYSLCRTHINSCDFSIDHYSYAPMENDTALTSFSVEEDRDDIIPMIREAQGISKRGFKLVASPWTASTLDENQQ